MLCLRAAAVLVYPGVCFPHPAELTGSPLGNAIKAALSVTNLIQDKPANPFTDYNLMAGGSPASGSPSSGLLQSLWTQLRLKGTLYK